MRTYIYTRNSLDRAGADEVALTADDAHFDFEESVMDALDNYFPLNEDGDGALTIEPIHPISDGGGKPVRAPEADIGFLRSHLDWQVRYIPKRQDTVPGAPTSG